jgi:hypothetical protein
MLAWLYSYKSFCSDTISGHETVEFFWQEIIVVTKDDPGKAVEAAYMSLYNLTKTVLDLIKCLRDDNSSRENIPDLYEFF